MALSQSQKIIAFLEKHRGGSFTARQIAEAIVQQYASDYAKKRNNPRFADDKAFLSQIIAEIGSQKDTLKRLRPTLVWQDRPKPRRYCIPLEETQEARDTAQGETCERDEESCACEERALLEQELVTDPQAAARLDAIRQLDDVTYDTAFEPPVSDYELDGLDLER